MLGSVGIFLLACPDRWEKRGFGTQLILVTLPVTWFGIWSPFLGSLSSTGDWDPTQNSFSKENMQFLGRFNRHWFGFVSLEAFRDTGVCWEGLGAANIPGFGIVLEITRFKLVVFSTKNWKYPTGRLQLEGNPRYTEFWAPFAQNLAFPGSDFDSPLPHRTGPLTPVPLAIGREFWADFGWILSGFWTSHTKPPPSQIHGVSPAGNGFGNWPLSIRNVGK